MTLRHAGFSWRRRRSVQSFAFASCCAKYVGSWLLPAIGASAGAATGGGKTLFLPAGRTALLHRFPHGLLPTERGLPLRFDTDGEPWAKSGLPRRTTIARAPAVRHPRHESPVDVRARPASALVLRWRMADVRSRIRQPSPSSRNHTLECRRRRAAAPATRPRLSSESVAGSGTGAISSRNLAVPNASKERGSNTHGFVSTHVAAET